ncbi:MAG: GAF domain-containing protein [bacterium]|nr:GAF domain-containing protein [bacterium]MDY4100221.1 HD domain-containing phosphohydrolase [Lachnospiraceae bacterium]
MKQDTLQTILNIGIAFSREKNRERLLDRILTAAMDITQCDGGTLYINNGEALEFKIMITRSQGIHKGGEAGEITLPAVPLSEKNVCACGVLFRRLINIPDVYESEHYDFSGPKNYDAMTGYHTQSMMVVPLEDDKENVIGVVQLINALNEDGKVIPFRTEYEQILLAMGSQAAICLVNMNYSHQIRDMLDSYVRVMSTAIDARTPYNANHTKNMVAYAKRFISWLQEHHEIWKFDENKTQEFLMSVWLHDVGKLITPMEIMDKQDRLAENYAFIMDRFEKIRLLARIEQLEGKISAEELEQKLLVIREAAELVGKVNKMGFLPDDLEEQIRQLAERTYLEEDGSTQPWITPLEQEELLIKKGTLTQSERAIMQDHVEKTRIMLEQMALGDDYKDVLPWASQHHELLNGTGYPKGLKGEEICREVRLLTILDVFEAMTAHDRPYKKAMPAEHAFKILHQMADQGQVDEELLNLFEQSRAWITETQTAETA